MDAEANKELVRSVWTALAAGDIAAAFKDMSEDVSWLIPGTMPGISGLKEGKHAILDFMRGMAGVFPDGLQSEIHSLYADGDTVIVELTNRGKVSNGRFYENDYCFVFELEAGKVRRIREYVDTQRAQMLFAD